jgi:hypothetical protein
VATVAASKKNQQIHQQDGIDQTIDMCSPSVTPPAPWTYLVGSHEARESHVHSDQHETPRRTSSVGLIDAGNADLTEAGELVEGSVHASQSGIEQNLELHWTGSSDCAAWRSYSQRRPSSSDQSKEG